MLYPRTPEYQRKAQAFAEEFELRGGAIRATVPYDSGTTTFEDHMKAILSAASGAGGGIAGEPVPYVSGADTAAGGRTGAAGFALFVAAPERDIRQIAPQLAFYGLDSAGMQVLGDAAWAGSVVRRVVPARDLEGVIAASHFPPDRADAPADPEFIALYEDAYRRSLQNQLPALGYDAANLVLQALPNRLLTPGAVARRFGLLTGIRGATGLLSVRADQVVRAPYLVRIRGGKLEPAPLPTAAGGGPGPVDDGGADDGEP
jgi:ABC-type branched-subunit amino acid transport system substrate-binding protein